MNGAALLAFRTRVQAVLESFQPATVSVNGGESIAAATSGLRLQTAFVSRGGGIEDDVDIKFRIRKELLPEMPTMGRIVWVEKALSFVIVAPADAGPTECAWLIGCKASNEVTEG